MTDSTTRVPTTAWRELPLPGNYKVLALQMNLTVDCRIQRVKWVISAREAIDQYELFRHSVPGVRPIGSVNAAVGDMADGMGRLLYLAGPEYVNTI